MRRIGSRSPLPSGQYAPVANRDMAHRNVETVRRALTDLSALPDLLSSELVWHFFGEIEGVAVDHVGPEAVFTDLWAKLFEVGDGTFAVVPVDIRSVGDELVVAHVKVTVGTTVAGLDAVVVYRLRDGLIIEAFDIPSRAGT